MNFLNQFMNGFDKKGVISFSKKKTEKMLMK